MKNKIKQTCSGTKNYAPCIQYQLDLPEISKIEDTSCVSVEDTTEDTYLILQEIKEDSDLSELENNCLEYNKEEDKLKLKEVLIKYEEEICDLKTKVEELENGISFCNTPISECNYDLGTLTDSCGEQPITNKDLIQIILDKLNENTI